MARGSEILNQLPTILVVDDDTSFLRTVEIAFRDHGRVLTAHSPETAIRILEDQPIHVIMSDFMMGRGTGHDIARVCNSLMPRPPVILVTGFADKDLAIKSIDLKIFALLEKPVDLETLIQTLERAITESKQRFAAIETQIFKGASTNTLSLNPATREACYGADTASLTLTEFRILAVLLEKRGQRVRREDLITLIWGNLNVSRNVFDTHFSNLKRKFPSLKEKLRVVRGEGYVLKD